MLKRVYLDNYRAFVNFELFLERQQLIMGLNGSGKSTLLEALTAIRRLVTGNGSPDQLFPSSTRTRWQTLPQQTFELDVDLAGSSYKLQLELGPWGNPERTRIKKEAVLCEGRPIFEFVDGEVHLFNDRFDHKVTYPFNWFTSALATVQPRSENTKLTRFTAWMENLRCFQFNPRAPSQRSEGEDAHPAEDMSNFASWYRHMNQERGRAGQTLQEFLRQIIPGSESLDLRSAGGNLRTLEVSFMLAGSPVISLSMGFEELSDGQRVLVFLYALLSFAVERDGCIFLDEPENYVAMAEIQPWLMELRDRLEARGGQVILVSHHPELIDYLAPELGLVFERSGVGPVRVKRFASDGPLSPSERTARGW